MQNTGKHLLAGRTSSPPGGAQVMAWKCHGSDTQRSAVGLVARIRTRAKEVRAVCPSAQHIAVCLTLPVDPRHARLSLPLGAILLFALSNMSC